jgi:adenylate cyclase
MCRSPLRNLANEESRCRAADYASQPRTSSARRLQRSVSPEPSLRAYGIEGLNKEFGSQLLISNVLHQEIGNVEGAVSLGDVPIRGYQKPIKVWRLA